MPYPFSKYVRTLQLIRDASIPKNPVSCDDINKAFKDPNIMETMGISMLESKDVFFDGAVDRGDYKYAVFSSKYSMKLIVKHIEDERRHLMVDPTFKVCPIGPIQTALNIPCGLY